MRRWRWGVAAATCAAYVLLGLGCLRAIAQEHPDRARVCGGEEITRGAVGRTLDGRTFALDDGREVRLAGVEVPPVPAAGAAGETNGAAPGGAAARDALAALLSGGEVVLRRAKLRKPDRYGRIVAYAATARDGNENSVQAALVAGGFARVGARAGDRDCMAELLGREQAARKAKLGLWADPYYDLLRADDPADVLAEQGRFALVEGKVVSVHESGATTYVNFGRRWTEEFTVTIWKRNLRGFRAAGLEPKRLAGRRIRVRGWIEERGGPLIEATSPEQIEFTDRD